MSGAKFQFMLARKLDERGPGTIWGNPAWSAERKYDGWRCAYLQAAGGGRLVSRGGLDITGRSPALANLHLPPGTVLDGELLGTGKDSTLVVFDALQVAELDLRRECWVRRREAVELVVATLARPDVVVSELLGIPNLGRARAMIEQGAEGIILKLIGSRYECGRRSGAWRKYKAQGNGRTLEWAQARGYRGEAA